MISVPQSRGLQSQSSAFVFVFGSLICWASANTTLVADTAPNVVIVMTDDQGWGDFGVNGNLLIRTPHIDAMAKRSVSWEEFYVSPVCSPTRASLMTGRYNQRTKCIDTFKGRSMMATDEVTIAEVLREAGYATGIFGKWHLGDNYPMRPSDQGFDESLVHKGGGLAQPSEPIENQRRYTDPLLFHNNREVATDGYCTDVFFQSAKRFIRTQHAARKPFFCYIPVNAPHGPFHDVPEDLLDSYKETDFASIITNPQELSAKQKDTLARIASMITNIDDNMAGLFDQLEKLGIVGNTLVVFLTDNGPNTRRYVGEWRGKKSELYEGGIRTPLWMHWPSKLPAGTSIPTTVAAHIDLMPTLLEACGVDRPDDLDGRSLWAKLQDRNVAMPARPLCIQYHRGDQLSRYHSCMVRFQNWKLVHPSGTQREAFLGEPAWELYDLARDPGETDDLMKARPEIGAELIGMYERWFDDVSQERADQVGPPPIVIDPGHENPSVLTWQDMIGGNWRTDQIGFYKIDVANAGRFDVRFESHPSHVFDETQQWVAKLEVAGETYEAHFDPANRLSQFRGVVLPAGRTRLKPWVESPDAKRKSVYHVWISSR